MGTKQAEKYAQDETRLAALPTAQVKASALATYMASVHVYRYGELPRIDLYLDQVLTLVSEELAFMCLPDEQPITGSMVNNYVKQRLLPAPRKKRYTREHVATLLFVCSLKRVYSIAQLQQIMGMINRAHVDAAALYDEVVAALECALAEQFAVGPDFVAPVMEPRIRPVNDAGEEVAPGLARVLEAAVASLAAKVYVEQTLALAE